MKERYLVVGASGFIGANLTRKLAEEGKDVHGLTREKSNTWRLKDVQGVEIILGDITNKPDLQQKLVEVDPTHIINLATYGVYRDQKDYQKIIEVNLTGSLNLFEASRELKNLKLLINTGSVYEYGSLPGQMKESTVAPARNFYDATKVATTAFTQSYSSLKILPICTIRPFTAYGPYEDSRRLVSTVINTVKAGKNPRTSPEAIRDFIYIDDLVDAYILALQSPETIIGQIINIGSGQPTKIKDFVSLITDQLETDIKPIDAPEFTSPTDSQCWADIKKAKNLLSWQPSTSNIAGIKKTIRWHLQNQ
jgi:nucleoside-diphosphate-sugar epimerase